MAAPTWPGYVAVQADGHELGDDPDVLRTPWEDGASRQARVRTAALRTRAITVLIDSDADAVRFRAWLAAHAHVWFAWTDPEDGVTRQVRVRDGRAGATLRADVSAAGVRRWTGRLVLEGF